MQLLKFDITGNISFFIGNMFTVSIHIQSTNFLKHSAVLILSNSENLIAITEGVSDWLSEHNKN